MEIKLNDLEILTILHGLENLHDVNAEYKDVIFDDPKDYIICINSIRELYNKILIKAQNEGCLEDIQLI